jgi:hypothetical protein
MHLTESEGRKQNPLEVSSETVQGNWSSSLIYDDLRMSSQEQEGQLWMGENRTTSSEQSSGRWTRSVVWQRTFLNTF